jgi:hypothetical protein
MALIRRQLTGKLRAYRRIEMGQSRQSIRREGRLNLQTIEPGSLSVRLHGVPGILRQRR